jgi:type I restriction enzyme S subunit
MKGLWETALALEMESLKLTTTRDELLPLLMSRKVRVKDAEKTVEGVL